MRVLVAVTISLCLFSSCAKTTSDGFTEYIIRQGNHYAEGNIPKLISNTALHFMAKFDSSCIYTTINPDNSGDINKLYGFSDCGNGHQESSARVGWVWNGQVVELYAYCYAGGIRSSRKIGAVAIGEVKELAIAVNGNQYVFICDGQQTVMTRYCNTPAYNGYQLYPYFGGDETAPHDIHVFIKEL